MKDLTEGKLDEALKYAESIKDTSLKNCLSRLDYDNIEADVMVDFAPYSFYFVRKNKETGEYRSNGGIIFHGKHDNGGDGGSPTFSVNLTPCNGWQTHT